MKFIGRYFSEWPASPFSDISILKTAEENIWTKEGWSDGSVEKTA
jgi:hypothetical protein